MASLMERLTFPLSLAAMAVLYCRRSRHPPQQTTSMWSVTVEACNLSLTPEKLLAWEKKLCKDVKINKLLYACIKAAEETCKTKLSAGMERNGKQGTSLVQYQAPGTRHDYESIVKYPATDRNCFNLITIFPSPPQRRRLLVKDPCDDACEMRNGN